MNFDEMTSALREARNTIRSADSVVERMAEIIVGRLRKANVGSHILRQLKKELESFNMHTGRWK